MPRAEDTVVIRNIYYMMAYAFRSVDIGDYAQLGEEEFETLDDLLAAILSVGIESQRRRGFEQEYNEYVADSNVPKGRIRVASLISGKARKKRSLECVFDEFTENTQKNRIMKAAAYVLVKSPRVSDARRKELKRLLMFLRDVEDVEPSGVRWPRRYHRNSGSYQLLMNLCYLVLNSYLPSHEGESRELADFMDNQALHALYEHFVLEYFKKHHPRLNPSAKVIDTALSKDAPGFVPRLCTDMMLSTPDKTLIIDTKCYGKILNFHYGKEILPAQNYHQLFTYVATEQYNSPAKRVEGMLLYALTENDSPIEDSWDHAGYRLHARTLDLGQNFSAIKEQLDTIAALL